jgi:glycosyltransferase involved in cell wall biosynthesis
LQFLTEYSLPELFDHIQSSAGLQSLRAVRRFLQLPLPAYDLQLIHSFEAYPWGIYGRHLAQQFAVPHIITTHGRYGYIAADRWLDRIVYGRVMRDAHTIVAVSEAVRAAINARFPARTNGARIIAIQNAVDAAAFGAHELPEHKANLGAPLILSVTRFVSVKDVETAVRAFKLVRDRVPEARYAIVGPGNGAKNYYHQRIQNIIHDEGISGVEIVGRVSRLELQDYYLRSTLLLHTAQTLPDDFEASGLILLEAGLFGLPVVASKSGGIPEVVTDNVTGLLAPERNIGALAAAMLKLLADPVLAGQLGEANRRRALERNWSWYMKQQQHIYEEASRR